MAAGVKRDAPGGAEARPCHVSSQVLSAASGAGLPAEKDGTESFPLRLLLRSGHAWRAASAIVTQAPFGGPRGPECRGQRERGAGRPVQGRKSPWFSISPAPTAGPTRDQQLIAPRPLRKPGDQATGETNGCRRNPAAEPKPGARPPAGLGCSLPAALSPARLARSSPGRGRAAPGAHGQELQPHRPGVAPRPALPPGRRCGVRAL